jgi:hypothetical protein
MPNSKIQATIDKLLTKQKRRWCQRDKGEFFPYQGEESSEYKSNVKDIEDFLSGERNATLVPLAFEGNHFINLYYSEYFKLCQNDTLKQTQHFIESTFFGFLWLEISHRGARRVLHQYAGLIMGQCLICGWDEEADLLAENSIESINTSHLNQGDYADNNRSKRMFIDTGETWNYCVWFILDIYCAYANTNYSKEYASKPALEDYLVFTEAVDNWNSEDLTKVDVMVYKICEFHLDLAINDSNELGRDTQMLFPYEVHAWMAYRKRAGLKNPEQFSHPLMNQVFAEPIEGVRPFAKPDVEYLEALFKLYENDKDTNIRGERYTSNIMDLHPTLGKQNEH